MQVFSPMNLFLGRKPFSWNNFPKISLPQQNFISRTNLSCFRVRDTSRTILRFTLTVSGEVRTKREISVPSRLINWDRNSKLQFNLSDSPHIMCRLSTGTVTHNLHCKCHIKASGEHSVVFTAVLAQMKKSLVGGAADSVATNSWNFCSCGQRLVLFAVFAAAQSPFTPASGFILNWARISVGFTGNLSNWSRTLIRGWCEEDAGQPVVSLSANSLSVVKRTFSETKIRCEFHQYKSIGKFTAGVNRALKQRNLPTKKSAKSRERGFKSSRWKPLEVRYNHKAGWKRSQTTPWRTQQKKVWLALIFISPFHQKMN